MARSELEQTSYFSPPAALRYVGSESNHERNLRHYVRFDNAVRGSRLGRGRWKSQPPKVPHRFECKNAAMVTERSIGPLVLIVDDSELAREAVKDTLESAGLRVVMLESAFGFIRTLREKQPSLILLDVGLASMNGTKLVQLGREHAPRGAKLVLYSGRSPEELAVDARDSGADGFISKRTTDRALVLAVQGYLNGAL
jgi:two-component system, OmpR family, response regulator